MSEKKHTNQIHIYNIPFPVFVQRKLKKFQYFFAENYTHIYVHKPTYKPTYKPTHKTTHKPTYIYIHKKQKDKNPSALSFTDADAVLYTRQRPHL